MSPWQICVPYRSKSDSLADIGCNMLSLEDAEDRATTAQLILVAAESGCHTAGDMLSVLEEIERRGATRKALDLLRRKAGFETATALEERERIARSLTNSAPPLMRSRFLQCAADGCEVVPRDRTTMLPVAVETRRWYCPDHASLAQPGDLDPITKVEVTWGGLKFTHDETEPPLMPGLRPGDAERFAETAAALAAFELLTRPETEQ
jgi:hypothetical protein